MLFARWLLDPLILFSPFDLVVDELLNLFDSTVGQGVT